MKGFRRYSPEADNGRDNPTRKTDILKTWPHAECLGSSLCYSPDTGSRVESRVAGRAFCGGSVL